MWSDTCRLTRVLWVTHRQTVRYLSKANDVSKEIRNCCNILNISYDFNESQLRSAYLEACKASHPDTGHQKSDHDFYQIESAYQKLKNYLKTKVQENDNFKENLNLEEEEEENNWRPKVAQHRQYLTLDGVGFGTPTERQKQYQTHRLTKASDSVNEFHLNQIKSSDHLSQNRDLVLRDANLQRKRKIKQGFERLVEDLIQESMAKGDFNNLPGAGKPLKNRVEYPYLDSTTFKLNEILINNGFVPEWILLEKEIRDEKNQIKEQLLALDSQSKLTNTPLVKQLLAEKIKEVNKKIDKYNRIVPILTKQQILVRLDNEIKKLMQMRAKECDQSVRAETNKVSNFNSEQNDVNKCEGNVKNDNMLKKLLSLFSE